MTGLGSQAKFHSISEFLGNRGQMFSDLKDLLDWHFDRMSDAEREIMHWLAVNREPVSYPELKEDILSPLSRKELPSALHFLLRGLPIEKRGKCFTIQPVLMEHMTDRLIGQETV